jgi:flagellar hook-associated protein 2
MAVSGTTSGTGNLMRITGMATGLDVDSMVKKMVAAQQTKIDKASQDQQIIKWRQEAYQDIIKDVRDLQRTFFDSLSSNNILSSSAYAAFDVNVIDSTAASITPKVSAQTGSYAISFQTGDHLAAGAKKIGAQLAEGTLTTTKMYDLGMTDDTTTFTLTYNGSSKDITIKKTDSIIDVINNINTNTSGAVVARYSELTRQFTFETSNTGSTTTIGINKDIAELGLTRANAEGEGTGQDAVVHITPPGGEAKQVIKSSNSFTIDGIGYNLLSQKDTTFTVTQNTQKVEDNIKKFLDQYNAIVDKIQTKLTEKKQSTYKPLTDAQKESMSDTQIANWEAKAKQGIMRNDNNLQNLLTSLRSAFSTPVSNNGLTFGNYGTNAIGIDTSDDFTQGAKISIVDKDKLKSAIAQHGDQILKLFTNVSASTDKTTKYNESGIFQRISDVITQNVGYIGTTLNNSILTKYASFQDDYSISGGVGTNTLPDQIYRQDVLIKQLNDKLRDQQEKYYKQFSNLETAMNKLNSQFSWLSQQFGTSG